MLECMKNRRSIRKYTDQDIPESLLNELLEVATRASNTGNMQLYSVVVTRDPANKEKLAPAHFNQPMITMLFAQSFCNAAEEKGLGICYLGTTAYNADQIIEALSLPRLVVPIVTVTVGYPAEPIPAQVERLPLAAVVQNETYTDFTPASIDALYSEKEALEVNKQFVRENNKETLAQVFTDVRYTKKNSEHFSEVLLKVLKQQGFMK